MNLQPFLIAYYEWVSSNLDQIATFALLSVVLHIAITYGSAAIGEPLKRIRTVLHIGLQFVPVVGIMVLIYQATSVLRIAFCLFVLEEGQKQ